MTTDSTCLIVTAEITLDDLRTQIRREPGTLYAILDACDEPRVPEKVQQLGPDRAVSLYRGWAEQDYWAIAPYLVQVDEPLFDWVVENLWNDPWGVFVITPVDLLGVRKHFRRFLMVEAPDGKQMYFRFYDPRVLPTFLKTCTELELGQFSGAVEKFLTTRGDQRLIVFGRHEKGLTSARFVP